MRRAHPAATLSTRRLEAFTDGVFAIAATLLVLDLTTSDLRPAPTDAALWEQLAHLGPVFLSFTISFLLLCMMWLQHVSVFEHVVAVDTPTIWMNSVRLFGIVLVPFTTSLTGQYSDLVLGRVLLPANFAFVIAVSYGQWLWLTRDGNDGVDVSPRQARLSRRNALSALLLALLALALSPLLGPLAFLVYVFDGLLSRLLGGGDEDSEGPDERGTA
ncbi:TMEM175 family protein [Rathayibacter sp. YIM 133350]|uniref:TMEM175 family protein n=1 Tax=Rathayibacter sp. YIM 133350 TaxID=3131992 RepID=UPI00307FBA70